MQTAVSVTCLTVVTGASTAVTERPGHQPELKRVMGPKLLLFIVGDILGTGI
jgi:hypothetical protein